MPTTVEKISSLEIKIGSLWRAAEGTSEKMSIDAPLDDLEMDAEPVFNFKAKVMLIKLKDEISVVINDAKIKVKMKCNRCTEPFEKEIFIASTSREFKLEIPANETDRNDSFLINIEDMKIDLTEMVRQEIILHFPLIPVCSKSCKGLCQGCGKNKNTAACKCEETDKPDNKPFKNLKKIISK